jgi:hypothetical protein
MLGLFIIAIVLFRLYGFASCCFDGDIALLEYLLF